MISMGKNRGDASAPVRVHGDRINSDTTTQLYQQPSTTDNARVISDEEAMNSHTVRVNELV